MRLEEIAAPGDAGGGFEHAVGEEAFGFFVETIEVAEAFWIAEHAEQQRDQRSHALQRRDEGVLECLCGVGHGGEYPARRDVLDRFFAVFCGCGNLRCTCGG